MFNHDNLMEQESIRSAGRQFPSSRLRLLYISGVPVNFTQTADMKIIVSTSRYAYFQTDKTVPEIDVWYDANFNSKQIYARTRARTQQSQIPTDQVAPIKFGLLLVLY